MSKYMLATLISCWLWLVLVMIFCTSCTLNMSVSNASGHGVDSIIDDTQPDFKTDLSIPIKGI